MSVFGGIMVHIFSAFSRIRTEFGQILRISPYSVRTRESAGKMRTRITSNTDTFYVVTVSNRKIWFFKRHIWYSDFSIFIANITIGVFATNFNLFRFYWKYFNIVLSFLLYSFGENKFVYFKNSYLLSWNQKIPEKSIHTVFYKYLLYLYFQ